MRCECDVRWCVCVVLCLRCMCLSGFFSLSGALRPPKALYNVASFDHLLSFEPYPSSTIRFCLSFLLPSFFVQFGEPCERACVSSQKSAVHTLCTQCQCFWHVWHTISRIKLIILFSRFFGQDICNVCALCVLRRSTASSIGRLALHATC